MVFKKVDINQLIKQFTLAVLKTTTKFLSQEFEQIGKQYTPKIVFTSQYSLQMYNTQTLTSPFYLPKNQTIYLDLSFYHDLERLLGGSSSNFEQGYIIDREVAHHAQNLLGTFDFVEKSGQKKHYNMKPIITQSKLNYKPIAMQGSGVVRCKQMIL